MAYFPFMIEVNNKKCLVVGGGKIALHKVKKLQSRYVMYFLSMHHRFRS